MKDGRTHLAYKSEHVVDLESEVIRAAEIYPATDADTKTLTDSVTTARCHMTEAGLSQLAIDDDGGGQRLPRPRTVGVGVTLLGADVRGGAGRPCRNSWKESPAEQKHAVYATRRRVTGKRGRALQRLWSEKVERSFAHLCETGGSRRSWLRGFKKVCKRYAIAAAARNLGMLMRMLFGMGKPKTQQPEGKVGNGPDGLPGTPESFRQ